MSRPLGDTDPYDAQARLSAMLVEPGVVGRWVPGDIVEALARTFPEVEIMWHSELQRWWLVQTLRDGRRVPFRMLGTLETPEEPTYHNTVEFVGRLARAMESPRTRTEWLDELDATSGAHEVECDARARMAAGARDLYPRLFKDRVVVAPKRDLVVPGTAPGKPKFPWARKRRSGRWASR